MIFYNMMYCCKHLKFAEHHESHVDWSQVRRNVIRWWLEVCQKHCSSDVYAVFDGKLNAVEPAMVSFEYNYCYVSSQACLMQGKSWKSIFYGAKVRQSVMTEGWRNSHPCHPFRPPARVPSSCGTVHGLANIARDGFSALAFVTHPLCTCMMKQ